MLGYMYTFQLSCRCDTSSDLREIAYVSAAYLGYTPLTLEPDHHLVPLDFPSSNRYLYAVEPIDLFGISWLYALISC